MSCLAHAKVVHSIVGHVARQLGTPMEEVYRMTAWAVERAIGCEAYEAFCAAAAQPAAIFNEASDCRDR